MDQQELYNLAGELSDKDIAYLVCSHLEHIRKMEMGWTIDGGDRVFVGQVICFMKNKMD